MHAPRPCTFIHSFLCLDAVNFLLSLAIGLATNQKVGDEGAWLTKVEGVERPLVRAPLSWVSARFSGISPGPPPIWLHSGHPEDLQSHWARCLLRATWLPDSVGEPTGGWPGSETVAPGGMWGDRGTCWESLTPLIFTPPTGLPVSSQPRGL